MEKDSYPFDPLTIASHQLTMTALKPFLEGQSSTDSVRYCWQEAGEI